MDHIWCNLAEQCTIGAFCSLTLLCSLQIEGPNVAPLTVGKQNLVVYVLRQLEKHFFEVNQFFRIHKCSHDESLQQANVSLAIVTHNDITVGLDVVRGFAMLCAFCLLAQPAVSKDTWAWAFWYCLHAFSCTSKHTVCLGNVHATSTVRCVAACA